MNGKFISYLRVSTQRQGKSGLGLAAQREAINAHLNGGQWKLVAEYVEVESGKNSDRPTLAEALAMCRLHRATLLVAKLDRLARNVAFIAKLMDAGVKFRAVDMPEVNEMVVHILASVAQGEARAISDRTKAALAAAKARGTTLGGLRVSREHWDDIAAKGRAEGTAKRTEMACEWAADVLPIIKDIYKQYKKVKKQEDTKPSLRFVATALNERGIETRRGGQWSAVQVQRVLALF